MNRKAVFFKLTACVLIYFEILILQIASLKHLLLSLTKIVNSLEVEITSLMILMPAKR
jgi:hypothetical protein